jgi:ribosomal protein S12 methylthiotransferase
MADVLRAGMKTVALVTFGCAKNLVDSEVMSGLLLKQGYSFVATAETADVVILNTCGFIRPAKEEAESALREAIALKRRFPEKKIIAAGCYVERYMNALRSRYPEIDAWLGVGSFDKIVQAVEGKFFVESAETFLLDETIPRAVSTPAGWAYLKISEGCSHQCSFCAIPLIKGTYRSRAISSIVEEAKRMASRGVKEVNLISQDTTYFGRDSGHNDGLVHLLRELAQVKGLDWIRILYGYPEEITDAFLEIMQEPKICPYLDVPFQHADTKIIEKMRRSMDGERALKLIHKIRNRLPDIALRTTLVVGFPGEGSKEFNTLRRFVKQAQFYHLGVFAYSAEEGTGAFDLGDPVREPEKLKRKNIIMGLQAEISYEKNKKYVGRKLDVLVEGRMNQEPRWLVGRSRFQAPEVDGVVFIDSGEDIARVANSIRQVEIQEPDVYDLSGKFVK